MSGFPSQDGGATQLTSPVYRLVIDSEKVTATSEYQRQTICFCAMGCKIAFDKNRETYVGK
jgi:YHS domain-containing protein